MSRKKSCEITEELLNKIISVAYGDGSFLERIQVMRAASQNIEVYHLLNSYKTTANEVKNLGEEEFPNELLRVVETKTTAIQKTGENFIYDFLSMVFSRPIVSAATSLILIAAVVTSLLINRPVEYKYNYSAAEITEAEKQAEYALSIVGKFFNETNSTLKKEVLGEAVAKPFGKSIGIVNNILEGDQNGKN